MREDDPERAKKAAAITVGEDLSAISVDELAERIGFLENEITRIRQEIEAKKTAKSAADAVFGNS